MSYICVASSAVSEKRPHFFMESEQFHVLQRILSELVAQRDIPNHDILRWLESHQLIVRFVFTGSNEVFLGATELGREIGELIASWPEYSRADGLRHVDPTADVFTAVAYGRVFVMSNKPLLGVTPYDYSTWVTSGKSTTVRDKLRFEDLNGEAVPNSDLPSSTYFRTMLVHCAKAMGKGAEQMSLFFREVQSDNLFMDYNTALSENKELMENV